MNSEHLPGSSDKGPDSLPYIALEEITASTFRIEKALKVRMFESAAHLEGDEPEALDRELLQMDHDSAAFELLVLKVASTHQMIGLLEPDKEPEEIITMNKRFKKEVLAMQRDYERLAD